MFLGIDRILGQSASRTPSTNCDPSNLDLPDGLQIKMAAVGGVGHCGVFCTKPVIAKGTQFGPFAGKVVNTSEIKTNDDNSFMWEVRTFVRDFLIDDVIRQNSPCPLFYF